ncbi:MAG: hypothetical protein QOI38_1337 [Sphingomonadales bacterium]|nr:hypothetical protein [Sphingomonadales bacterium]
MIALLQANFFPLAAALLIGVATARWTFRRPPSGPDKT